MYNANSTVQYMTYSNAVGICTMRKKNIFNLSNNTKTSFLIILLLWFFVTLSSVLFIINNQLDNTDALELLSKTYEDLTSLQERHRKLLKSYKNLKSAVKVPQSPKYEFVRRRIQNNVQEFWYFLRSELNKLKNLTNTDELISMAFEYKKALIDNVEEISEVDGFNDWRSSEIRNLSNIVQQRLYHLQHPVDCENAKKLVCSINYNCGFGCQMHHLISCMTLAYGTQRTLILESKGWQYNKNGWDDIFKPLSSSCTTTNKELRVKWPGSDTSKVINIPKEISILPRPQYLPQAVPDDVSFQLSHLHGNPIVWWVGQMLKYIWKPQNYTKSYIQNKTEEIGLKLPFVGVHIRRTDKIAKEASFHSLEEYMNIVEEYFNQFENKFTTRRVYIATDDVSVHSEAKANYPNYEFFHIENIKKFHGPSWAHSDDNLLDVIFDVQVLSQSDFLVCTMSSNICRLAYELMQNNHVDASRRMASLDDVYYYCQQEYNKRRVIIEHSAKSSDEIDLVVGDIVHIAGNHWNGYSLGTNLRTSAVGFYPSFKVEVESTIVKFPHYFGEDKSL